MPTVDDVFLDEFILIKGTTPYTGADFTPPAAPWTIEGTLFAYPIVIAPDPEPIPVLPPLDISKSDFCLEIDFRIENLFEWLVYTDGTPNITNQYYGVVGQFDQEADGSLTINGNYWSLYLRVNTDYSIDAVFEVYENGAIVTQLVHSVAASWSDWDDITKTNLDADNIHLAVSRSGDLARLFVNGNYSSESTAAGALVDFTTINGDWQIMGPSGQGETYQPPSVTTVDAFRVFDYAYYWENYGYAPWDRRGGICIYPMIGMKIRAGIPGSIRARLTI